MRLYLKKEHHKKGLVEWLKVKTLSSNPVLKKKKSLLKGMKYFPTLKENNC
jgi:hypothetical protein